MTHFEYIAVIVSIILGLGIVRLLVISVLFAVVMMLAVLIFRYLPGLFDVQVD